MVALTVAVIAGFIVVIVDFSLTWKQLDRIEQKLDAIQHG
jgi:hypothetical protein